jgi:hypothetical protein
MRVCSYILVGLLFVGAGLNQASALSLDALDEGGSLESGALTFSDFDVVVTGAVSADLSLYDVSAIDDGFAITGPISAADGEQGDLFVEFTVSVSSGAISGVGLSFNGAAAGAGSDASVVETFEGISDLELFVFATGGGGLDLIDEADLSATSLRVAKDILVDSTEGGGIAVISRVEQTFEVVPEPAAAVLLGMGLVGVAFLRRRQVVA